MSYNGSGTFAINTAGQPVVTGTIISSTAFNSLTADLATGLSTAITKDGQTATTVRIPFAQGISSTLATDSTSTGTGSIITAGGVGIAKALYVGTTANVAGAVTLQSTLAVGGVATFSITPIFSALTASSAVATDASKNLVSVTNTGTGNNVLATSPTLVTPALGTPSALVGTNITGTASGLTAGNVINNANLTGAVTSVGNAASLGSFTSAQLLGALTDETGTGANVFATSPTLTTPNIDSAQFATVSGTAPLYAARAWVNFNGTGTVAIRGSGNVSSITDNGVGIYTANLTTAMPDTNGSISTGGQRNTASLADLGDFQCSFLSTSTISVRTFDGGNVAIDWTVISLSINR